MNRMHPIEKLLILICGGGMILLPLLSYIVPNQSLLPSTEYRVLSTPLFPSPHLLLALRTVESSLRPDAVSEAGARGLYQIMPLTWQDHSTEPFSSAFDPSENEKTAIVYLKWLRHTLSVWEGQEEDSIPLDHILSCWHGGIGRFRQRGYSPEMMPNSTRFFVDHVTEMMK